jgi:hypothetical protein
MTSTLNEDEEPDPDDEFYRILAAENLTDAERLVADDDDDEYRDDD